MAELVPSVPITLDKPRNLRFDLNAMVAFERATGKSIRDLDIIKATDEESRALIWSCLIHEDKDLKLEDVGALSGLAAFPEVWRLVGQAVFASLPEQKETKAELPQT
jgi:hypothetical protein